jgi:CubicO group peptidase (beta-lactamase class C family)
MTAITVKVDRLFTKWDKPDSPGCALAVIQNGEIVYKRGYGMANLEYDIPISPHSVFDIASNSKQFTAMCIVLLARQNMLTLDDELQKYIPEIPRYSHPITLRHLIYHTSGLRDYLTLMNMSGMICENKYLTEEIIALLARQQSLNFQPGTERLYSNTGYLLLGEIVKRVSGKSLRVFAEEQIFAPLGMKNTHFHDNFKEIVKNRADSYLPKKGGGFQIDMSWHDNAGAGFLYTTIEDLSLWDRNFYENILGNCGQDLIEEITTICKIKKYENSPRKCAFGLLLCRYRGLKVIKHGGAWFGYRSDIVQFPEHNFSVICLANVRTFNPTKLVFKVADIYLDCEFKGITKLTPYFISSINQPSIELLLQYWSYQLRILLNLVIYHPLVDFIGTYYSAELEFNYEIHLKNRKLLVKYKGHPSFQLRSIGKDIFFGQGDRFEFVRDDRGTVIGLDRCSDRVLRLHFIKQ